MSDCLDGTAALITGEATVEMFVAEGAKVNRYDLLDDGGRGDYE